MSTATPATERSATVHMVGNAHLDPAWMWTWGEGMEAFIATCRSALDRMDETPGFTFSCSSAAHYAWVEEVEPELFRSIEERVREGRWNIVGGWWVQADCNLPSGEGLARQALLGQRYFARAFGRTAATGYSPDAFGHNAGLPQLLARAGMNAYIFCRPDPSELRLPSPLVRWRSMDGSAVLAYRVPFHYNMYETSVPKKIADLETALANASNLSNGAELATLGSEWMLFYGVGNHGGGPTREQIAQIEAIAAAPEHARPIFSTPDAYFARIEREPDAFVVPDWEDDLQLNAPGCYAAHSGIKALNRTAEHLLAAAERISALAAMRVAAPYPAQLLHNAWRSVCFNHFHDILCGVAIREALNEAIETYGSALDAARTALRHAVQRIARRIDTSGDGRTLVVFNPHAWPIDDHVTFELWHDIDKSLWSQPVHLAVTDDDGTEQPCQPVFTSGKIGSDRVGAAFRAQLPALGWRSYRVHYGRAQRANTDPDICVAGTTLANRHLRVQIDRVTGMPSRIANLITGSNVVTDAAALMIRDETDTWGHGVTKFDDVIGRFTATEVAIVENGPLLGVIRARLEFEGTRLQLDYRLHHDTQHLTINARLFLAEAHRIVKLAFQTPCAQPVMTYESAYCCTSKPCDGTERPTGTWCAVHTVEGDAHGLGIVSDTKHSFSADRVASANGTGATLAVTVARSAMYATHDPHPYNANEDSEALDMGLQRFGMQLHAIDDEDWRTRLSKSGAQLVVPPIAHFESVHAAGPVAQPRTYGSIDVMPASVAATVVKQCEDSTGWVVRLFEMGGRPTVARLALAALGHEVELELQPHEVATILISDDTIVRTDLAELRRFPLAASGSNADSGSES